MNVIVNSLSVIMYQCRCKSQLLCNLYLSANGFQERVDLLSHLCVQGAHVDTLSNGHLCRVLIKVTTAAAPVS